MLKIKFLAALGIVATLAFTNSASAQSNRKGYTLSGDSLTGINQRTANQDFSIFFTPQTSTPTPVNNNVEQNTLTNVGSWRAGEMQQIGNTPVLLQPGDKTGDSNDGLQLQFDLTNTNQRKDLKIKKL
ncbi:MAG: hypothetical protein WBA41_08790 [Rivularia sp. (in: cyanobacteria)]